MYHNGERESRYRYRMVPTYRSPLDTVRYDRLVPTRDVEPEPAFFDPTGAGAVILLRLRLRSKLKKSFFNCREYLFGKYVECTSCKNYVERIKTLPTSALKGPQVTHA